MATTELVPNQSVIRVAAANTGRPLDMVFANGLAGDARDHVDQLIDRHHLVRADIDRPDKIRAHQPQRAFQAFVDVKEGAGLLAVAPDLDLAAVRRHRDFAADRGRRLLRPPFHVPSGPKMLW